MNVDLLIQNGTILDGTGAPPFRGDVAVRNGQIVGVGDATEKNAKSVIDATGLVVAPGFIDIHSHSDFTLVVDPRAVSSVTQGVTFELVGNCGHGCAPIGDPDLTRSNIYGCRSDHEIPWRTVAEYLDVLQQRQPAVNVATLVPNGNLRLAAAGLVERSSNATELRQMKKMLAQGLEEGAFGYSTGLEYSPERDCSEDEIVELCGVAAQAGGMYATHTRNRSGEAQETIDEAIRTAAAADVPLQISHIGVVARLSDNGQLAVQQAIRQVQDARSAGLDVGFDMHTRLFGTTNLSAALPGWALEGDRADIAARLRSPSTRSEMKSHESIITAISGGNWNRIVVFDCHAQPEWSQCSIAEIADQRGIEPFDAIYDLLLAEIDRLHELMVLALTYREEELQMAFDDPDCMVGSDATALATDGPLAGTAFHGAFTWAGWFFRHFVRDRKLLTPQEAVRRFTSLPARRLGLSQRGTIREGACADLAIFDADQFAERGTMFQPNQVAVGMRYVVVNGVMTIEDGRLTGLRGGQVLRR